MRRTVLLIAALVFLAGLFLDTVGLIELSWLCVSGRCGLPVRFVLPGLGLLLAGGALLLGPAPEPKRRRRTKPGSTPNAKARQRAASQKAGSQKAALQKSGSQKLGSQKAALQKAGVQTAVPETGSAAQRTASARQPSAPSALRRRTAKAAK